MGNFCDCCGVRNKEVSGLPEYGSGGNNDYGFAFARHDRARMEDAVAIDESIAGHKCFAVFDGHGGDMAAKLAQKLLPQQLESNLHKSKDKEQAAIDAFPASDQEMQKDLANEARVFSTGTSSGTVCCAALLQDKELILLNLGDCRAVVCESAKVAEKTADHSPDKNKEEKQRLVNLGVNIDGGYVDGQVQVSRALGDVTKSGCKISGLICRPEVTIVEVRDATEFVILATDGIWDALQEQTALTTARKVLRETRSPEAAAQAVLQAAAKVSRSDNAALIVVALNIPEPPAKRERRLKFGSKTE